MNYLEHHRHNYAQTILASDENSLPQAVSALNRGCLVAFPTDTVYGLAAKYDDFQAVRRLYSVKERPLDKAIPILIGALSDINELAADFPPTARALAETFWPGALTLVVKRHERVPKVVAPSTTVAMRMPAHEWLLTLLQIVGPLAVSSANRSGKSPKLSAGPVRAALGEHIELIIDGGPAPGGKPSTVADCSIYPPVVLRDGPVTTAALLSLALKSKA